MSLSQHEHPEQRSEISNDMPCVAETPGWHVIHELHACRRLACVCVERAVVTYDLRRATPYVLEGCVVGFVSRIDDFGFVLSPFSRSFQTRVEWRDVRRAWPRQQAPDRCPHCGYDEAKVKETCS